MQCLAALQLHCSSIMVASWMVHNDGSFCNKFETERTPQSDSKQATTSTQLSRVFIFLQISRNTLLSSCLLGDDETLSATRWQERNQWTLHPLRSSSACFFPTPSANLLFRHHSSLSLFQGVLYQSQTLDSQPYTLLLFS